MARRSELTDLLSRTRANDTARERAKVVLLTLGGQWSVKDGCEHLGMKRTRFQDLRRRMLDAAVGSLEGGVAGRPPGARRRTPAAVRCLEEQVTQLQHELQCVRTQLELAESEAGAAVLRRRRQASTRRSI